MEEDLTFKDLVEKEYGSTEKTSDESWRALYERLKAEKETTKEEGQKAQDEQQTDVKDTPAANGCSHELDYPEATASSIWEIKKILYKTHAKSPLLCDLCSTQTAAYLNLHPGCHSEACLACLEKGVQDEEHYPIQLELETADVYCFQGSNRHKLQDTALFKKAQEVLKEPESDQDLDSRRKAEHMLYIQELRREEMSLKHYFVEKQWGRTWMLFRTREGSPLPGKITNNKLARGNNTLDPNVRLPMDKYRPSPETHADIISIKLWRYLEKAYGIQGKAYNEDDIIAPEYARLRVYVDDFKKSIDLYP